MLPRRFFDRAWSALIGGFVVLETAALLSDDGSDPKTLSAYTRRWLGLNPRRRWSTISAGAFLGFCAWLGIHITFGILNGEGLRVWLTSLSGGKTAPTPPESRM